MSKMQSGSLCAKLRLTLLLQNPVGLFLIAFGLTILAFVGWVTWDDMTLWSKDLARVFFDSRTDQAIGLGVGMKVVYYFLTGLGLLLSGAATFLLRWSKNMRKRKMSEGLVVTIPLDLVDNIRKRSWFKHYHDMGDFVLNAIKSSIESWDSRAEKLSP